MKAHSHSLEMYPLRPRNSSKMLFRYKDNCFALVLQIEPTRFCWWHYGSIRLSVFTVVAVVVLVFMRIAMHR